MPSSQKTRDKEQGNKQARQLKFSKEIVNVLTHHCPLGWFHHKFINVIRNKIPKSCQRITEPKRAAQEWTMTTQIHDQEANSLPVKQVMGAQHTFFGKRFTDLQRVQMLERQRKTKSSKEPRFPRQVYKVSQPTDGSRYL